jgi:transcriptional regulator of acetoin/glycerol metabolism
MPRWLAAVNPWPLRLPPLRERRDDIPLLAAHFLQRQRSLGRTSARVFSGAVMARLEAHSWPGNLRELRNVIEFASAVCRDNQITLIDLPEYLGALATEVRSVANSFYDLSLNNIEASELIAQLRAARWNVTAAANAIGISRMTLYRRMKRYGIEHPQ